MKRKASILLAAALCISSIHIENPRAALFDDEYALRCAAIYAILEKAYDGLDQEKTVAYNAKFKKLELEIWKLFEQNESGRARANDEIQKYVNEIVAVGSIAMEIIPGMVRTCDDGLETFEGL